MDDRINEKQQELREISNQFTQGKITKEEAIAKINIKKQEINSIREATQPKRHYEQPSEPQERSHNIFAEAWREQSEERESEGNVFTKAWNDETKGNDMKEPKYRDNNPSSQRVNSRIQQRTSMQRINPGMKRRSMNWQGMLH